MVALSDIGTGPARSGVAPLKWLVVAVGILGLALLVLRHWFHVLGVLPYLVLLTCPILHVIHRRHGAHGLGRHSVDSGSARADRD